MAARLLRTRPASSIQGIPHTAVPEQAPVHRGPSLVPHRDTEAARTTSRQVCACDRLCLFACARAPELLQLQPNISTGFVSRGNLLISVSTVGRRSRAAVSCFYWWCGNVSNAVRLVYMAIETQSRPRVPVAPPASCATKSTERELIERSSRYQGAAHWTRKQDENDKLGNRFNRSRTTPLRAAAHAIEPLP